MSEKLLPCPFCGHDSPEFERTGDPGQSCIVICGNCGARHESSDEGAQSGSSWNDRTLPTGWKLVPVKPTIDMLSAMSGEWHPSRHDKARKQYAAMLAARPSAPTAVEPDERATCEWTLEDDDNGTWQSSCGELWSFIDGGPKENRVSFCHHCGKPAVVRASKGTPK